MEKAELEQLVEQLKARREQLREEVVRSQQQGRGEVVADEAQDEGDKAASAYEKEYLFHRSHERRQALQNVEMVLARIGRGSFGVCDACGEEIEAKRLKALPWARYCLSCQDKLERGVLEEEVS